MGTAVNYPLASDHPLIRGAWIRMQGWYKDAMDPPPLPLTSPSLYCVDKLGTSGVILQRNPPCTYHPGVHSPFSRRKLCPQRGRGILGGTLIFFNCSGFPSGIQAEHLRAWIRAATWENTPDPTNLCKLVYIVQSDFQGRTLVEDWSLKTVLLIPKGGEDFRGILFMNVLWKNVTGILDRRLTSVV